MASILRRVTALEAETARLADENAVLRRCLETAGTVAAAHRAQRKVLESWVFRGQGVLAAEFWVLNIF